MNPAQAAAPWHTGFLRNLLALCLALATTAGWAQDDPPGRVGRVADLNGAVSWWDHEAGQWSDAERNRPLTGGDRISTAINGRAELRVGSTSLRLGNNTELEVLRLDDERMVFQLHSGSVALRVRSREVAAEVELITAEARLLPLSAGHYRLDRIDDTTQAGSWRGEWQVDGPGGFVIGTGQRAELFREGRGGGPGVLRQAWKAMPNDGFNEWVTSEDRKEERSASARYVSPEMTGAEDLDRNGRWEQHPEFGAVWMPFEVRADWAPYRYGHWAWVVPWGWTWIDEAPWGFAPFHYGRWVSWRSHWCWVPGAWVQRPVYAPAMVAWVGGDHWGVSLQIGGPAVGWVPLAPREVYRPHYRVTPIYVERMNPAPRYGWHQPPGQVPTGPVMYGNQGVPNAVTVVARDVLTRRQPVGRVVVELPRAGPSAPLLVLPAPAAPPGAGIGAWRRPEPVRAPAADRGDRSERGDRRDRNDDRTDRGERPAAPAVQPRREEPREVIDLRQPRRGPAEPPPGVSPPAAVQPPAAPVAPAPAPAPLRGPRLPSRQAPPPALPQGAQPAPQLAPVPQSPATQPAPAPAATVPTPAKPAPVATAPAPMPAKPIPAAAQPAPVAPGARPPPPERSRERPAERREDRTRQPDGSPAGRERDNNR